MQQAIVSSPLPGVAWETTAWCDIFKPNIAGYVKRSEQGARPMNDHTPKKQGHQMCRMKVAKDATPNKENENRGTGRPDM